MSGWHSVLPRRQGYPLHPHPAVGSYIIARPCRARRRALCSCHWWWLWLRLSGGWGDTVKGLLPALQPRKTQPDTLANVVLKASEAKGRLSWFFRPGFHTVICLRAVACFKCLGHIRWLKTQQEPIGLTLSTGSPFVSVRSARLLCALAGSVLLGWIASLPLCLVVCCELEVVLFMNSMRSC